MEEQVCTLPGIDESKPLVRNLLDRAFSHLLSTSCCAKLSGVPDTVGAHHLTADLDLKRQSGQRNLMFSTDETGINSLSLRNPDRPELSVPALVF